MEMYLIKYELVRYYYLADTKKEELIHIVKATSEYLAERKLKEYWENQDSEYSISHLVNIYYCNEIIE